MLKPSQFNYSIYNNSSELLLYNSYVGSSSFCKIPANSANNIYDLLQNKEIADDSSPSISLLKEKGFLVDTTLNEDDICYCSYLKAINNNYLHLVINPTDACNFQCIYCYESNSACVMDEDTQNAIIQFVKQHIQYYDGLHISWFGGEPLLQMNIIRRLSSEFMNICVATRRKYIATITTNGFYLNSQVINELVSLHVIHYQITIDGTEIIHNKQRPLKNGQGTFQTIFNNLLEIKNKCKRSFYNISLRTNYTLDMLPYIDEFLELMEKTFMDNPHFDLVVRPADDWGGDRVKSVKSSLFGENQYHIDDILSTMQNYHLNLNLMKNFFNPSSNFCYASQLNSYSINSSGEISKCTTDLRLNPNAKIGEIVDGQFVIDQVKQIDWLIKYEDTCSCFFKPVCMGIKCPKALYEYKQLQDKCGNGIVNCPFEKEHIKELFLLFDKQGLFPYLC